MRTLTAVLTAAAVVLLPACGTAQDEASAQERIAQAPAATEAAGSARMDMDMTMTVQGDEVTVTGEGAMDFATEQATMTMEMGALMPGGGSQSMEIRTDGSTIFLLMPNAQEMGLPTPWIRMDVDEMAGLRGLGELQQMSNDPAGSMNMLRGASEDIREVGTEEIRGVSTTHYQATVDLERAAEQAPEGAGEALRQQIEVLGRSTVPVEVWLDDEGRVRRQQVVMDLSQAQGAAAGQGPEEMRMTVELFDFGAEVDVAPPPPPPR
ncbi:MAG TPA: DUF6612 family protein [Egibacteraceae bacterium]|nr:DUF6612 family protein [Egibacteraceae bacterium]